MSNETATQKMSRIRKLYDQYFWDESIELEEFLSKLGAVIE
tara:strand:- start:1268 stop:1390 length:123 start_codon:yes stop_codon:yes gene_type:complete